MEIDFYGRHTTDVYIQLHPNSIWIGSNSKRWTFCGHSARLYANKEFGSRFYSKFYVLPNIDIERIHKTLFDFGANARICHRAELWSSGVLNVCDQAFRPTAGSVGSETILQDSALAKICSLICYFYKIFLLLLCT